MLLSGLIDLEGSFFLRWGLETGRYVAVLGSILRMVTVAVRISYREYIFDR